MNSTLPLRGGRLVAVQHHDGRRDAGAVEEVRRQADDDLEQVLLQQALADLPLGGAAEQHAVGHHDPSRPRSAFSTATMCWTNAKSPLVFGGTPNRKRP